MRMCTQSFLPGFNSCRGKLDVLGHTGNSRRLRRGDCQEFDISVVYTENPRLAGLHIETLFKKVVYFKQRTRCAGANL